MRQKRSLKPDICASRIVAGGAGRNGPYVGMAYVHNIAICLCEAARRVNGTGHAARYCNSAKSEAEHGAKHRDVLNRKQRHGA